MNKRLALSAATIAALALSVHTPQALAAPVPKSGHLSVSWRTAAKHRAPEQVAPSPDAVAMAEAEAETAPRCETEAGCPAEVEDSTEARPCPEDNGVPGADGCSASSGSPEKPPRGAGPGAIIGSVLGGLLGGPGAGTVIGAILSQPDASKQIGHAVCGLLRC